MNKIIIVCGFIGVLADRVFKTMAAAGALSEPVNLIGNIFKLELTKNYYIAFSLPVSGWWLNALIAVIVSALIYSFVHYLNKKDWIAALGLALIILGAASNLFDRLIYGYVIDYLSVGHWTVFNLADAMITGGVFLLAWTMYTGKHKKQA